jgi:predicted O-methyltransferase YrrM
VPDFAEPYGRFHLEATHRNGGIAPPPFRPSESLHDLIRSALTGALREGAPLPPATNLCALQPDTLAFLGELLNRLSPETIVEFGSGASTICFARWASEHGARLISIEHDRGWFEETASRFTDQERAATDLRHAPLGLVQSGLRLFLTYQRMDQIFDQPRERQLVLIDGPHWSGREAVLYTVLSSCTPGTIVVLDDYRHYAIREMLLNVAPPVAACFVGEGIEDNSHGFYVLRCERSPDVAKPPRLDVLSTVRSYWRCFRDFRQYGTGS